ncbi:MULTISPECIES: hypothetical protein [unclassified Clostridium]|uniref:hypothetical protein n=1 Tax=unclassified Clostridium TaxID=2614128 RepID=UPI003216DC91
MGIDYGAILIFTIMGIYFIVKYIKNKRSSNLVAIFMTITGIFYKQNYSLYNNVSESAQIVINIIYWISILALLIVGFINRKTKKVI